MYVSGVCSVVWVYATCVCVGDICECVGVFGI